MGRTPSSAADPLVGLFFGEKSAFSPNYSGMALEKIQSYIEENPVRAGLVREANEYRWSSAGWVTRGSPADQGVRPTAARRL